MNQCSSYISVACLFVSCGLTTHALETIDLSSEPALLVPNARYGSSTPAHSVDDVVLASLYRMGEYSIAVERCESHLRQTGLDRFRSAMWTSRLIIATALRDVSVVTQGDSVTIETRLQNAVAIAKPYVDGEQKDVHAFWVRFAIANATYQVTERQVAAFLAAPANLEREKDCLDSLRRLSDFLDGFRDDVFAAMSVTSKQGGRNAVSSAQDFAVLVNRVLLLKIDSVLLRGRMSESGSDDSTAIGTEALTAIEQALSSTDGQWAGRASLELAQWQAVHMIGRDKEALAGLEKWIANNPSHELLPQAFATAVEACITTHSISEGQRWLQRVDSQSWAKASPEIAIAKMAWAIASWRQVTPSDGATKEESLQEILQQRDEVAAKFGVYWGYRAEAVILRSESAAGAKGERLNGHNTSLESMAMIKLELKQLLVANRVMDAVDRLRQSESMALKNGDLVKGLELAKLQIGLLVKGINASEGLNSESKSDTLVNVAQQIEATSQTYSELDGSAELNQFADTLLLESWKLESDIDEKKKRWNRYEQHLVEHLEQWPLSLTSEMVRNQLEASYLASGRVELLVPMWAETPQGVPFRDERFVNALLMATQLDGNREVIKKSSETIGRLPASCKLACRWLLADWSWWTKDGGIDLVPLDQSDAIPLIETLPQASISFDKNEDEYCVDVLSVVLAKAAGVNSQSPSAEPTTEPIVETFFGWVDGEPINRVGLTLALSDVLMEINDDRYLTVRDSIKDTDRQYLSQVFIRSSQTFHKMILDGSKVLDSTMIRLLQDRIAMLEARSNAMNAMNPGDLDRACAPLLERKSKYPRDAKWSRQLAICYLWGSKSKVVDPQLTIDRAIQCYLQLASGSSIGSDGWFDAKLRVANCYRVLGKQEQSNESIALTVAMVNEVPLKWRRRLPAISE